MTKNLTHTQHSRARNGHDDRTMPATSGSMKPNAPARTWTARLGTILKTKADSKALEKEAAGEKEAKEAKATSEGKPPQGAEPPANNPDTAKVPEKEAKEAKARANQRIKFWPISLHMDRQRMVQIKMQPYARNGWLESAR